MLPKQPHCLQVLGARDYLAALWRIFCANKGPLAVNKGAVCHGSWGELVVPTSCCERPSDQGKS